ncbi:MAG: T9SS type A sorting domain-containing protein [Deferribacteres bacterium]|nr:T9SS type A sorting domain-containing protein [Deferribacteres bacterium]
MNSLRHRNWFPAGGAPLRMLLALLFTLAGTLPLAAAENVPAFQLGSVTDFPASNLYGASPAGYNFDATLGWSFTVGAADIVVSHLGIYDSGNDGLLTAHDVGIWTSDGATLVASVSIPSGTSATLISGCRYVNITPVTLQAGQTYVIGAYYPPVYQVGGGDQIIHSNTNTNEIFFATPVTWGEYRQTTVTSESGGLTFPNIPGNGDGILGPNFLCHYVELNINGFTATEGDGGQASFDFTVSLDTLISAAGATFDIATADGTTNPATAASDYAAQSLTGQTITAANSNLSYVLSVLVNGDTDFEADETFLVNVSNVTGAYVNVGQGIGTITNDDCVTDPVVTTNADSGPGSLRQAIIDACPGSTITFDMNSVVSPITLIPISGKLNIDKNLTIQGPGADILTTFGNNRIFQTVSGVIVEINGLTISGSNSNAIYNVGTLTLNNVIISGNTSSIGGSGIYNASGILTINNSTISDNTTFDGTGAGIFSSGSTGASVTINNSTISGNSSNYGSGGGIQISNGSLTINNSTISGNSASIGGGIRNGFGTTTLTNSTVSGNTAIQGGGIANNATLILNNSIVANSTSGGDLYLIAGTISAYFSLIEDGLSSINGTNSNNLTGDPLLGPLADNGGPTLTHALLTGSLAIDAGDNTLANNAGLTTDQRGAGFDRFSPVGGTVDIGAFELYQAAPPSTKPYLIVANENVKFDGTLLSDGDIHSNGDIAFHNDEKGTHTGNLSAVKDITIDKGVTIDGDATAKRIYEFGDITGTVTDKATVAEIPLPVLSYTAGGPDKTAPKKGSLTLAPGTYGKVKVEKKSTLYLTSGDYFMDELDTDNFAKVVIDVSGGPVNINVVKDLEIDDAVEIVIDPGGDSNSDLLTFSTMQKNKVDIGKYTKVLGNIIAPKAEVHFSDESQFRGTVCADKVTVEEGVPFLHHNSPQSLPKRVVPEDMEDELAGDEYIVDSLKLMQNYPNPFNPTTVIRYQLPASAEVKLSIYNTAGQLVRTLVNGEMPAGSHAITWDATDNSGQRVASGVYLYVIRAGDAFVQQRKLILMK